ncbi:MAG: DUF3801 domain-containing protein [Oscillospiraceae bacterium]|nr:DUF3801 domain-containing protein [Oscillospiraceae bacterium]
MNIGEGDAADKVMRLALDGGEMAVRLGGSALKNGLALLLACLKNHKKVYGKINMPRMFRETRDLRVFKLTREQFRAFKKECRKYAVLYSAVWDRKKEGLVSLVIPVTEVERANMAFEKIEYFPKQNNMNITKEDPEPKKESRSERSSRDTRDISSTRETGKESRSEKPSLLAKLSRMKEQLVGSAALSVPAKDISKKGKAR